MLVEPDVTLDEHMQVSHCDKCGFVKEDLSTASGAALRFCLACSYATYLTDEATQQ